MRKPSTVFVFRATCVLIAFIFVGQVSLFFLCRCQEFSDNPEDGFESNKNSGSWQKHKGGLEKELQLLRHRLRRRHEENVNQMKLIESLTKRNKELSKLVRHYQSLQTIILQEDLGRKDPEGMKSEFPRGYQPKTEFEVIPFDALTHRGTYHLLGGLAGNPAEKPYGNRGQEHAQVTNLAVESINKDFENNDISTSVLDLVDGLGRTDRLVGSEYDLYFRTGRANVYRRVKLHRSFGPLHLLGDVETVNTNQEWVNVILPLSGQITKFKSFLERFFEVVLLDRRVFLTVVYFGMRGRDEIQSMVENSAKSFNYTDYKLLFSDEQFSRGLGLQKGVVAWDRGNVLMFFCDVDVYFTSDFLERCRFYSAPGVKVYYPIVFSLYNPTIVYGGVVPSQAQLFRVNKEMGYWRDFGFGMTCQYQSDFLAIGGFDLSIKGWGMEDVRLYKKYVSSEVRIIRAPDRGLFHIWHTKHCNRSLTGSQYVACLNSKVKNEASHSQLGLLAFGKKIFDSEGPNWIEQLMSNVKGQNPNEQHQSPTSSLKVTEKNEVNARLKENNLS